MFSSLTDYEKTRLSERQPLPDAYLRLPDAEMDVRIAAAKAALGDRLVILGHHYQRDEVIKFADYTGDSLKLAQYAARQHAADYVVFCGVHFMAESANILGAPASAGDPARPRRRLLDGRHGRDRPARDAAGTSCATLGVDERGAGHVHQLHRGHQRLLRRARRHRLHVEQRARR